MTFVSRIPVRFGDVDYARIIYYPRLLHLLHVAFEDLFERHVGIPYAELLCEMNVGFPTVHMECDFLKPIRFGDVLSVAITVRSLGRTSVELDHLATVAGPEDLRARARLKRVAVDMETLRPIPVPERLRAAFAALRVE